MNQSTKRILSTIAIIIASVAFRVIVSADLGLMRKSIAQPAPIQRAQGAVTSVTTPSFADVAARVAPAVVSITTTEIVHTSDLRKRGSGIDPFEFFFPDPRNPRGNGRSPQSEEDDEHRQVSGAAGVILSTDHLNLGHNRLVGRAAAVGEDFV